MGEHVGAEELPRLHRRHPPAAHGRRPRADPADVAHHPPRRRPVHRGVHRPGHAHAAGRRDRRPDRAGRASRSATCTRCASTTCGPSTRGTRTFEANWDRVVEMVGEEVARVWRLYLVGGALAFEEGRMGVDQILMVKPTPDGTQRPAAGAHRLMTDFPWASFLGALPFTAARRRRRARRHLPGRAAARPARRRRRRLGPRLRGDRGRGVPGLRGRGRRHRQRPRARAHRGVGRPARGAHRAALARPRRGPAVRRAAGQGARQPAAVRAAADLPHPGRGDVVRLAAGAGGDVHPGRGQRWPTWLGVAALGWSASPSRPSATCSSPGSATTRPRRARCSTPACGATPGTRTTSATPASGGACP